jgi:glycosyl transferase family 25
LQRIGVAGIRFNAIKTASGAIGCSLSHIKCLEIAKENNYPQVFICEDDITFLNPGLFVENLSQFVQSDMSDLWDVVIVGGNNCPPYIKYGEFCIKVSSCQTTTGYIVKNHYYDTLIENMKEGVKKLLNEIENKQQYALDIYWKQLQVRDNWFMIVPPTVIQYEDYSDIEGRHVNYRGLMTDLDKEWLFQQQYIHKMNSVLSK